MTNKLSVALSLYIFVLSAAYKAKVPSSFLAANILTIFSSAAPLIGANPCMLVYPVAAGITFVATVVPGLLKSD